MGLPLRELLEKRWQTTTQTLPLQRRVWAPVQTLYFHHRCLTGSQIHVCTCLISEAYLEPSRTFPMEVFCKNSLWLLALNYFCKKLPSSMFHKVLNTPLDLNSTDFFFAEINKNKKWYSSMIFPWESFIVIAWHSHDWVT